MLCPSAEPIRRSGLADARESTRESPQKQRDERVRACAPLQDLNGGCRAAWNEEEPSREGGGDKEVDDSEIPCAVIVPPAHAEPC